jgi:hypothetical protein
MLEDDPGKGLKLVAIPSKTNVDTVVSLLFLFDYLLCNCPKLYLFVTNIQQDAYCKGC